jgi:hypothetical protein
MAHAGICRECAAVKSVLEKASLCLNSSLVDPGESLERLALGRAVSVRTPGFMETFASGWRQTAAAASAAAVLLAGFVSFGSDGRVNAWQSGLEESLEDAQYGIYLLQEESASSWDSDFDQAYAMLEDEKKSVDEEGLKGGDYEG